MLPDLMWRHKMQPADASVALTYCSGPPDSLSAMHVDNRAELHVATHDSISSWIIPDVWRAENQLPTCGRMG